MFAIVIKVLCIVIANNEGSGESALIYECSVVLDFSFNPLPHRGVFANSADLDQAALFRTA